jgi:hypothetical protein
MQPRTELPNAAAEDTARESRLRLWVDRHPVQQQTFRHGTYSPLCLDAASQRILCSDTHQEPVRGTPDRTSTTGQGVQTTTISRWATKSPSTTDGLVDIHDSSPTTYQWNYAAVEIVPTW